MSSKIDSGRYVITNVATGGTVQDHGGLGFPLYLLQDEASEPISFWDIQDASDGGYYLQNDFYHHYAARSQPDILIASNDSQSFFIEAAGSDQYIIKLPNQDSVWTAKPPNSNFHTSHIELAQADGSDEQRFTLMKV